MKANPGFAPHLARDRAPRSLFWATLLLALMAALGLAACEPRVDGDAARAPADPVALAGTEVDSARVQREIAQLGSAANAAQDASISATVQSQFALDSELRSSGINVDTFQGRVALRGAAPNASARERAAQSAAAVDGVRSIDNRLDVPTA
ncbi:MAG TPA: BON domain-containing protein [Aquabacterium sp.]|nr:BON domain-containing protein [Aquabacterium sp.]